MKKIAVILSSFFVFPTYGQSGCLCMNDTPKNTSTICCDTTNLKNNSKLYWQYDCKRIWLTLETSKRKKIILDEVEVIHYPNASQEGYHLIKEFKKCLLFKSDCPEIGPCIYVLIDKKTGSEIKRFHQLIRNDRDSLKGKLLDYKLNFILSSSINNVMLTVYFVDTKKLYKIPFDDKTKSDTFPYLFDEVIIKDNILTMFYPSFENKKSTVSYNLNDKSYRR